MASTKDRQRKLARARAERRLKVLAERQRRKRQTYAIVALCVTLVAALGLTWALGGFSSSGENSNVISGSCTWTLKDEAQDPNMVDVGHPEPEGAPRTGTQTMTLKTNLGDIEATIDLSRAPCTAASFTYLAGQNFFNDSKCTRYSSVLQVLQCGDPKSDGTGSPSYQFADEDLPTAPVTPAPSASASASPSASAGSATYYRKGQIVMLSTGANTNGSQFYIVTGDTSPLSAAYSIVGTVTKGMDIVDQVAKEGAVNDSGASASEGKPKKELIIQQLVMGEPVQPTPSATPSVTPSTTPPTSASPSPTS